MNFKRVPFKFTTIDPVKRQEELEKRFGVKPKASNMFVDFANGNNCTGSSPSGSPRLQHRVPLFNGDLSESLIESANSQDSMETKRKPRVRTVPIQIEREPAGGMQRDMFPSLRKRFSLPRDTTPEPPKASRVCSIPINVEKRPEFGSVKQQSQSKVQTKEIPVKTAPVTTVKDKVSNDTSDKSGKKIKTVRPEESELVDKSSKLVLKSEESELVVEALKKVENVKQKMLEYRKGFEEFQGTTTDKQYRFFDEMLTRCMLELDAIESYGNDEVRRGRKSMVREVQACFDLLDSKVGKLQNSSKAIDQVGALNPDVNILPSEEKEFVPVGASLGAENSNEHKAKNVTGDQDIDMVPNEETTSHASAEDSEKFTEDSCVPVEVVSDECSSDVNIESKEISKAIYQEYCADNQDVDVLSEEQEDSYVSIGDANDHLVPECSGDAEMESKDQRAHGSKTVVLEKESLV